VTGRDTVDTPGMAPQSRPAGGTDASPSAEQIAEICSNIIGVDIPVSADLFAAGLHSLDIVRIAGVLAMKYGVHLTAVDILDHPTAQRLAEHLTGGEGGTPGE
jgi:acyl carrier protein